MKMVFMAGNSDFTKKAKDFWNWVCQEKLYYASWINESVRPKANHRVGTELCAQGDNELCEAGGKGMTSHQRDWAPR